MEIILSNNRENPSLRFKNFMFNMKTKGKMSAAFVCTTPGCYASLSLRVDKATIEIQEPYVIPKNDSYFEVRDFMNKVKSKLNENISQPTQQFYEEERVAHRTNSDTTLPDSH
jgi:hypothetical protein